MTRAKVYASVWDALAGVDDARRRHPVSTGDIEIRVVVRGNRDQRGIDPRMNVTG